MSKVSERAKITLGDDWFDMLVEVLTQQKDFYVRRVENSDPEEARSWQPYISEIERLLDKFVKYVRYEENDEGRNVARLELFHREASDLIWHLLAYAGGFTDVPEGVSYYAEFKAKHEAFQTQNNK